VGVISDTHGRLRPEALAALRGSDLIIHAGDIGSEAIVPELRKLAPVVAVHGNVDSAELRREFPAINVAEIAGLGFYVLHSLAALDLNPQKAGFAAVIAGHTHRPEFHFGGGVLYFNPGSAGPRRFHLPVTLGRIVVREGKLLPEIVELEPGWLSTCSAGRT